jgi:hypothetical protein
MGDHSDEVACDECGEYPCECGWVECRGCGISDDPCELKDGLCLDCYAERQAEDEEPEED